MQSKQFHHPLTGGGSLCIHRWLPDGAGEVKSAVLIVHGMAEHGARYARLAQALTDAGHAVYAPDLPGHGRTARAPDELGHVSSRGGWLKLLSAINAVRELVQHQLHDPPIYLLGHSMGSMLLQDYLVEHGHNLAGAIFSATTGDLGGLRPVAVALLKAEAAWYGRAHRSALAEALTFKDFNRRFRPARTGFEWLSRDAAEVDKYVSDPACGFRCSCALWIDLFTAGAGWTDAQRLARIPKSLPVLLIGGSEDPATRGEAGPRALERSYQQAGIRDVSVRIWPGARHELLNETCRDEVTAALLEWLAQRSR
ncbi:MAG TPA: alpha/beta hydrolase [Nevskiaceae bacterium]|nr:alpha/beta hydrolase [Nevskiaceae bacterium]